jgi:phosphatidate cytidylyltransferase
MSLEKNSGTMLRVFGAVFFAPVVAAFYMSQSAAQWIFLALAMIMVWEFSVMHGMTRAVRIMLVLDVVLFALPAPFFYQLESLSGGPLFPAMMALGGLVVLFVWLVLRDRMAVLFAALLILCILSGRALLGLQGGHHFVLGLGLIVAACDIAAYFVGRRVGGRRLAPVISPNKTLSGAAGGMIGAAIASIFLFGLIEVGAGIAIIVGAVIAVLAQMGDLLESALKRHVGVKDSGRLIPGHGGVLDRFDGYLLTLPAMYIYSLLV